MKKQFLTAALLLLSLCGRATVYYVSANATGDGSSWQQASPSIDDMLDRAQAGDEIWIASGTYKPTRLLRSNKERSFAFTLKDGVSLYGGFAGTETDRDQRAMGNRPWLFTHETVLSADDDVADKWQRQLAPGTTYRYIFEMEDDDNMTVPGTSGNANHLLYCAEAITHHTELNGLTLRGANADVWNVKAAGAALYAIGDVSLSQCMVTENQSYFTAQTIDGQPDTYGGAVFLQGAGNASISRCLFARNYCHSKWGNSWGGAVFASGCSISECEFEDCVSLDNGGAVALASGSISDCRFTDCYGATGGAVYNAGTVSRSTIYSCRSLHGGGIYNEQGRVAYCIIADCYADATEFGAEFGGRGAGIYLSAGEVLGSVVCNNSAFVGGGIYIKGGRVINSTVQHNGLRGGSDKANIGFADGVDATTAVLNTIGNPDAADSNFEHPTSFKGRALNALQLQEVKAASWALAAGSSFIDAGSLTAGVSEETDIAGNPRVAGESIDVGAYESPVINTALSAPVTSAVAERVYTLDGRAATMGSTTKGKVVVSVVRNADGSVSSKKLFVGK